MISIKKTLHRRKSVDPPPLPRGGPPLRNSKFRHPLKEQFQSLGTPPRFIGGGGGGRNYDNVYECIRHGPMYRQKDFITSQFCDLLCLFLMNYPRSNSVLQRVKYTHFYRFCIGNKPTHIVPTSPYSLYRSTPHLPCDMCSLKNA